MLKVLAVILVAVYLLGESIAHEDPRHGEFNEGCLIYHGCYVSLTHNCQHQLVNEFALCL